jgi:hypothetical protein
VGGQPESNQEEKEMADRQSRRGAKRQLLGIQLRPASVPLDQPTHREGGMSEKEPQLEQMLAAFDPAKHGGEVMAVGLVGNERFA